jgi:hypothetical protein
MNLMRRMIRQEWHRVAGGKLKPQTAAVILCHSMLFRRLRQDMSNRK